MKINFKDRECTNPKTFCGLKIWQQPKNISVYSIGVDVAEGKNSDASVAQVMDCKSGLLVASYWNNSIDVDNFAAELYKLGNYYNRAQLCIEANNHGHAVIALIGGSCGGLAYSNLYYRMTFNEFTQKRTKEIGFLTTSSTKPQIIESLKAGLRDGDIQIFDKETIKELSSFVIDTKTGRVAAKGSSKDDRVMALALAWHQAKMIKEGMDITSEYSDYEQKYDEMTGFPII